MDVKPINLAAIDAGSNGIKMLLGEVDEHGTLWELESFREPVRLGHDAFTSGSFSEETIKRAVDAFQRFRKTMDAEGVERVRAVGTSACRSAKNAGELIRRVEKETGIELEVIDGLEEARLVFRAIARTIYLRDHNAVLIDVGGGSVEVTVAKNGNVVGCETLELGPVRLLEQLQREGLPERETDTLLKRFEGKVRQFIDTELDGRKPDQWIGTGGGVQALGELRTILCNKGNPAKLKPEDLDVMIDALLEMKVERRIKRLRLKPDRADLVAISAMVVRFILKEASAQRLLIPNVGLRHGLLHQLAQKSLPKNWVRPAG